ncbi:type 4b pilus protein PilO2 [Agrobacterium salinitolerans]|nr:type 4b pilus protein PilO2 [Agrobacterium salinitolerans]
MSNNEDHFNLDDFTDVPAAGFGAAAPSALRGTVKIGKVEYAVDLQWETPQDPGKVVKEAREYGAGQSDRPDFFCVRKGVKTQYGLGYASIGHKTNLPSLAAHICQSKGSSFVALFEVDGGYYLLAVRDDAILSDAERFIDSLPEANEQLIRLTTQYDFPEVIAPQSLDIEGSREQSLESVLTGRVSVRLKDIKRSAGYIKLGVVAAIAVLVLVGGKVYWDDLKQAEIDADFAAQFNKATETVGLTEPKIEIPAMPWDGQLMGVRVLEKCFEEIKKFPLDLPGWTVEGLDCKPSGENADIAAFVSRDKALEQGGMPITGAMRMVKHNGLEPQLSAGGNGSAGPFGFTWAVGGIPKIPVDIATERKSVIISSLLQIMESRRTEVTFSPADSNEFWDGVNIEFKTSFSPLSFADVLGAVPGFMLDSLEYRVEDNVYTIKGKAYEQLPLPEKAAVQR